MGQKVSRAGAKKWADLPRVWVPCDVGTGWAGPVRVCDEGGFVRDIAAGMLCILDVPDGKGGAVVGRMAVGGRLVNRDGNRLLVHFADGSEFWVSLLTELQVEDGPPAAGPTRGEVALAVAMQGVA